MELVNRTNGGSAVVDVTGGPARRARCADGNGTLAHLFFSEDDFDIARAKAICERCSLATACLERALDRGESYGVWGGSLLLDGQAVRFAPRRGRPSKEPRVEFAEEVPVPDHLVA